MRSRLHIVTVESDWAAAAARVHVDEPPVAVAATAP